jgi:hypothetical protein
MVLPGELVSKKVVEFFERVWPVFSEKWLVK